MPRAALAAGLTRDQIVGVYAFETGGNGTYDMQAGVSPTRPRAISPAIGYNQLLCTNTVSILAERGGRLLGALRQRANARLSGEARAAMRAQDRGAQTHDRVLRTVPDNWNEYDRLAKTTQAAWACTPPFSIATSARCCRCRSLSNSLHFARAKLPRRAALARPNWR